MPVFTPDGKKMLYQDVKGFEDEWRKHHTSSVSRDIWCYDLATGRHTNLTDRPGEDRNPVVSSMVRRCIFSVSATAAHSTYGSSLLIIRRQPGV